MKLSLGTVILLAVVCSCITGCEKQEVSVHHEAHKVVVTSPISEDVIITQKYVCQIHSARHIEICAMESGYLEAIPVKEGQKVKQGDTMFKVVPTLYQAKLDAELAEVQLAQIEFNNTESLYKQKVVAQPEVALAQAKLSKTQAQANLVRAELNFATVKAPFDGIIDHQRHQQGSLIAEGDILTTLSDNSVMWVYFNVPERRYLEYMQALHKGEDLKQVENEDDLRVELKLATGEMFPQIGKIGAIEADFNNETGNIAFRADFSNPRGMLRHGQTGTVYLSRVSKDSVVIPQRATYEILAKKYVFVVEPVVEKVVTKVVSMADEDPAEQIDMPDAQEHVQAHSKGHAIGHAAANGEEDSVDHGNAHATEHGPGHGRARGIVRQREITIANELDDIYVIKDGLGVDDKIVLEGVRQVRDGEEVEFDFLAPEEALGHLKYHAE